METKSNLQFGVIRMLVWSNTYKDYKVAHEKDAKKITKKHQRKHHFPQKGKIIPKGSLNWWRRKRCIDTIYKYRGLY